MPTKAKKKTVAKPAKPAAKKPAKKAPARKTQVAERPKAVTVSVTAEAIALQAYYIGERRRHLGLRGNPESDWLEAERQLRR